MVHFKAKLYPNLIRLISSSNFEQKYHFYTKRSKFWNGPSKCRVMFLLTQISLCSKLMSFAYLLSQVYLQVHSTSSSIATCVIYSQLDNSKTIASKPLHLLYKNLSLPPPSKCNCNPGQKQSTLVFLALFNLIVRCSKLARKLRLNLFIYLLDHLPMFCPDGLLQLQCIKKPATPKCYY